MSLLVQIKKKKININISFMWYPPANCLQTYYETQQQINKRGVLKQRDDRKGVKKVFGLCQLLPNILWPR